MPKPVLSPEISSLVHHIELNKAGWWEKAVQSLILVILWSAESPLDIVNILEKIQKDFFISLDITEVENQIVILCSSSEIMKVSGNKYQLYEQTRKNLQSSFEGDERIENEAKEKFFKTLEKHSIDFSLDYNDIWESFNKEYLHPYIMEMGARTYELLSGLSANIANTQSFLSFLMKFKKEIQLDLKEAIIEYFNPRDETIRDYTFRQLNACFFLQVWNLKEETIDRIYSLLDKKPNFTIFLDTNFLLSVLELHVNPSNETARSLMGIAKSLSSKMKVQLYVLPNTVEEIRDLLFSKREALKEIRFTPNLCAAAASEVSLDSICRKYAEECRIAGHIIDIGDYFSPYIDDPINVLRERGVNYYDVDLNCYRKDQDVIDDIVDQLQYEKTHYGERAKDYRRLEHDMVLWHLVNGKRPEAVSSPIDVNYWVVTIDFRLLRFDKYRRRNAVPICVHPTAFINMLQFWIPRSVEFEEAVIGTFRLPFLFQLYDHATEKLTMRILERLSRFENVGDMAEDTIKAILLNEALRNKLEHVTVEEEEIKLIKEAIIEDNSRLASKLKEASAIIDTLTRESGNKEIMKESYKNKFEKEKREREELENRVGEVEARMQEKEKQENTRNEEERRKVEIRNFRVRWLEMPLILMAAMATIICIGIIGFTAWETWKVVILSIISALGLIVLWLLIVIRRFRTDQVIDECITYIRLKRIKNYLLTALVPIIISIVGAAVWELIIYVAK